ncbi:MAG: DGQHR domain-containing protein [Sphingomonas sp.]|uniref:DGQHR domain-containing protein n=1 Tax=Sphingomonas sp. TaxID=28214 RepID=UPI001AC8C6C5|nr:DGQHR domain-containing protein [Sphingomonas sp.]MBN8816575.1 DGQHR domain-containing protein [Sphingomonas sp.]
MASAKNIKVSRSKITVPVVVATVMGLRVARGYARICDLADMSRPDIYDAVKNPTGTQRDLSPKHARDAYEYVKEEDVGFFPEVFLALRDPSAVSLKLTNTANGFGALEVHISAIRNSPDIKISRVDGNHRLQFADGKSDGFPRLEKVVSFCLALEISKEQEIKLFRDINNNQRRMNTSHLDNIDLRLAGAQVIARRDPALYIARKLRDDNDSVLRGKVYDGGRTDVTKFIPLRTLKTGLEYMLSRPTRLTSLDDVDIQAAVIKNYFAALKAWEPEAWASPKDYLMLRGAGLWGVCFLGANVIDRALGRGKYKTSDMTAILRSGSDWDWSKGGDFQGYSGRGGALKISDLVTGELEDSSGGSLKSLIQKIASEIT